MHQDLLDRAQRFVDELPAHLDQVALLRRRYDAGLAWVHHPSGLGGCDAPATDQAELERFLVERGVPESDPYRNPLGMGTVVPTLLQHASRELCESLFPGAWTGEEIWSQLFSEPGAGSDLAGLATRAVPDGDGWRVTGQKVWTSYADRARWGLLLTRTDPEAPKHEGITVFVVDMNQAGVDVRPLRQATGSSAFSEVYLDDVWIPDSHRIGALGDGWRITRAALAHERSAIGGRSDGRESGRIGLLASTWRHRPELHTEALAARVVGAWIDAEVFRLSNERTRQSMESGGTGLEGFGAKVVFAEVNQKAMRTLLQLDRSDALVFDDWTEEGVDDRVPAWHYLRSRANSIEGGTTEVLLSQIADRVLGLPREPSLPRTTPWKEIPR